MKLRPLEDQQDMEDLYGWWCNPREVGEFLPISIVDRFSFSRLLSERASPPFNLVPYLIWTVGSEPKRLGYIIHFNPDIFSDTIEIRYTVDSKERGKGYAQEAVKLLVAFLFQTRTLERIQAISEDENVASIRLLEKNGFRKEGTLRNYYFRNGANHDVVVHSILREE